MPMIIDKNNTNIENMIYEIRGKQVMLDSDLAKLYECTNGTKDINKAVKRNINRFPERFMFRLTENEYKRILRFQNGTLELKQGKYSKYLPYVFTEEGVAMLSGILHTKTAIDVSIRIMDAFVKMRKFIKSNLLEQQYINNLVLEHDESIKKLQETFDKLEEKDLINKIIFKGETYDAYSLLMDILNKAKEDIIIIDNYAGKKLLDMVKNINKKIIIVSKNIDEILKNKYESQYNNVTFQYNDSFHDRFIILDRKIVYSIGASLKDLGKTCFGIYEYNNEYDLERILNIINN